MKFKDVLRDVYSARGEVFYNKPADEDILQAATQIYIAQKFLDKEENDG